MENETTVVKKRNPRPTNLVRATAYTASDNTLFTDRKAALNYQKKLDLLDSFEKDPIAEGVTADELFEYVKRHKADFHAVLRSLA